MKKVLVIFFVIIILLVAAWYLKYYFFCGDVVQVRDVTQKQLIALAEKDQSRSVYGINILITGYIDGTATIRRSYEDKRMKTPEPPVVIKGKVNLRLGGDWYADKCLITYEPSNVKSGRLQIKYAFSAIAGSDKHDSFGYCALKLALPKDQYSIGDRIELNFEIASSRKLKIRLFEEKWKSLFLCVTVNNKGRIGVSEYEYPVKSYGPKFTFFVKDDKRITGTEKIEVIDIDQNNPYRLNIQGVISKNEDTGNIVFDFSEFGRFEVLNQMIDCGIYGFWRPINPDPLDSLEDSTNIVKISVSE